jgi:hypothetical protein
MSMRGAPQLRPNEIIITMRFYLRLYFLKISDDEFGVCIVFSWLKNAVLQKKICRSELWFRETVSEHGPPGRAQTVRGAGEVDVNDTAWVVRLQQMRTVGA